MKSSIRSLVTAIRTLSILTVPGRDTDRFSNALYWFPVVGLMLGAFEAALGYLGVTFGWDELAALLVVLGGIALTRGIHADGLADMADGFFGGRDTDAALRIMKDPNVGSFGALALAGLMLLKWIAALKLMQHHAYGVIASGVMLARLDQVFLASLLPYARKQGGTANAFVDGAGRKHMLITALTSVFILFPLLSGNIILAFALLSAAVFSGTMTGWMSYRKIQGVTGDVLGGGSELTEAAVWIAGAFLAHHH